MTERAFEMPEEVREATKSAVTEDEIREFRAQIEREKAAFREHVDRAVEKARRRLDPLPMRVNS